MTKCDDLKLIFQLYPPLWTSQRQNVTSKPIKACLHIEQQIEIGLSVLILSLKMTKCDDLKLLFQWYPPPSPPKHTPLGTTQWQNVFTKPIKTCLHIEQ